MAIKSKRFVIEFEDSKLFDLWSLWWPKKRETNSYGPVQSNQIFI